MFAPTAALLVDAHAYLKRYLRNLALEQFPDGTVPPFVPSEASVFSGGPPRLTRIAASAVGWGDAAVMLPWALYRYYGDTTVLRRQYDSMRRWVDHLERTARTKRSPTRLLRKRVGAKERYLLDTGFHWGESRRGCTRSSGERPRSGKLGTPTTTTGGEKDRTITMRSGQ
nr:hypothetical protein [Nocardia donostiensis]